MSSTDVQPISDEQLAQLDAYFAHGEPSSTYRTIWAEEWFGIRERLRQAAAALDERDEARAECERLRDEARAECERLRDEARAECERLRAERPVGESYLRHLQDRRDTLKAQLARATEVLRLYADRLPGVMGDRARDVLAEIEPPRTDRICHATKAPCESPEACDAQQACAR